MKTIVITGSSSGIGKATAKYFAGQGWNVAATLRKPADEVELNHVENVSLYELDVTNGAAVENATRQILSDFGTVDVVLNNAGYGLMGAFEAATEEQIKSQFDTNVFGLMRVTRAFLPHFRANGAGLFLNAPNEGGVISPGGIGFDINCGVRLVRTNLQEKDVRPRLRSLVQALFSHIPCGVGESGNIEVSKKEERKVLVHGRLHRPASR